MNTWSLPTSISGGCLKAQGALQTEAGLLELGPQTWEPDPWRIHPQGLLLHLLMVHLEVLLVAHHPHWCHQIRSCQSCLPE